MFRTETFFSKREHKNIPEGKMADYTRLFMKVFSENNYFRTPSNAAAYDKLVVYFARYYAGRKGEADYPEKGFLLYGDVGTGKTMAALLFKKMFGVRFIPMWKIVRMFAYEGVNGVWGMMDECHGIPVIIDDLANEGSAKNYTNLIPVQDMIAMRSEDTALTFFTSNADGKVIKSMYGEYAYSRICGMCEPIRFEGEDLRTSKEEVR